MSPRIAIVIIGLIVAASMVVTGIGYDRMKANKHRNKLRAPRHIKTRVRTPAAEMPSILRKQAH